MLVKKGKPITTRTCSKCKTVFPMGKGHDARTCGKIRGSLRVTTNLSTTVTSRFVRVKEMGGGDFLNMESSALQGNRGRKEVFFVKAINNKVSVQTDKNASLKELSGDWLHKYTHVADGKTTVWFNSDGVLHRTGGPAMEHVDGRKEWWANGKRHRLDGPAVEGSDGGKAWCINDKLHRLDGPAVERADGYKAWCINDKLHRLDGPALERADGYKVWYVNDKLHREDGPAIEGADGPNVWYVNGERHRVDGPAIERVDGSKDWYVHDIVTEYPELCEKAILPNLTREELYKLCTHDDYVVRQLASHNPLCPKEYKLVVKLLDSHSDNRKGG